VSRPVRLAGSVRALDGTTVTWTVAEGAKGRRWREVVAALDGTVRWALLYETDPDGAFTHLELAAPAGLATLHPEGDGTLHGNIVTHEGGVRHVVGEPFPSGTALLVVGSLVAGAAVVARHAAGEGTVILDPDTLGLAHRALEPGDLPPIDADGAPEPVGGSRWPLEV
jgi:hypothetical protein